MRPRVLGVASSGGHLDQLLEILLALEDNYAVAVATFPKMDALSKIGTYPLFAVHYPTNRNIYNAIRNFYVAVRALSSFRPAVVVSTGAGPAVPFLWTAKLVYGVLTVYSEPVDRISSATLTSRLVGPVTDITLTQWPSQLASAPRRIEVQPWL